MLKGAMMKILASKPFSYISILIKLIIPIDLLFTFVMVFPGTSTAKTELTPGNHIRGEQQIDTGSVLFHNYSPLIISSFPLYPTEAPVLATIENADQDNFYLLNWSVVEKADNYYLEEANNPAFINATTIYFGALTTYKLEAKPPSTYYYRARTANNAGNSEWSNIQSITINPLHLGLKIMWEGTGEIHFLFDDFEVGTHEYRDYHTLVDSDTVEAYFRDWYDPNPKYWEDEICTNRYSISTGVYKSSTCQQEPDDEFWKWTQPRRLPYGSVLSAGQTTIDGEPFTVTGPFTKNLPDGRMINYWKLTNPYRILIYSNNEGITQYAYPGEIVLEYEDGDYGLLLFSDIRRNIFNNGVYTEWWVRYISNLTMISSNETGSVSSTIETQTPILNDGENLKPEYLTIPKPLE
jgi:hypothetical protein